MTESTTNQLLAAALAYAERGWPVFPVQPREKKPLTKRGFKDATTDVGQIRAWWTSWPEANIGLPTGGAFDVLDIDGPEGEEALRAILGEKKLPPAPIVSTGKGTHVYFAPSGRGNTASKLGPKLDTRGKGGYVIAPPSVHPSGAVYSWIHTPNGLPLPPWPELLATPEPKLAEVKTPAQVGNARGTTAYGRAALDGILRDVAGAPEGSRNHTLNRAAFRAGQLVAGEQIEETEALAVLADGGRRSGLPDAEASKTIDSGFRAGLSEPATAPERPAIRRAEREPHLADSDAPPLLLDLVDALALNAPRDPIPTGIAPLDAALRQADDPRGGIGTGEAIVIAGGPGAFKTTLVASIVEKLATPETAVLFIAADEPSPRVARKIGARYGETWRELCADYPPVLERLREKLATRGTFIRVTHPNAAYTLEDVLDAFAAVAPEGRRVFVILDHLHSVTTRDERDDDTEKTQIERAVTVVLSYVRRLSWSIVALSEVTKAALHVASAKETPLQTFAGTRKIASRFDAAFLMVPDGEMKACVIVAKNRFGLRKDFTIEVDPERWSIREVTEEEREERAQVAATDRDREDENAILRVLDTKDARIGIGKAEAVVLSKGKAPRRRAAIVRLLASGAIEELPGPKGSGRTPAHIRRRLG